MTLELEKYYTLKGYRVPKYSYINLVDDKGLKMYCAEVILPNGMTIRGEPRLSYAEVCMLLNNIFLYYK